MDVVAYIKAIELENNAYSAEQQKQDISEYCKLNGLQIIKWYEETGRDVSDCNVFDQILYEDSHDASFGGVIVARNDCVDFDPRAYFYFKMLFKRKKIFLFSVVEDFGEMSRLASFLDDYTNFICKMEDQYLSKRTMHARKKKAEMGGFAGGRNPYGYSLVNGTLVINEKEAYCVKRVFLLRSTGMKLIDIADLLNEAGYRTQTGKSFTPSTIQNILKHEAFYRGQLKHSQETYIGDYPRILD